MKITKSKTKTAIQGTLTEIPDGEPFDYRGTTLIKLSVTMGSRMLNSHLVKEVVDRGDFFCMIVSSGVLHILSGEHQVSRLKYEFTLLGKVE